jgi:SPP1 family predicted phage head-tail adaptor
MNPFSVRQGHRNHFATFNAPQKTVDSIGGQSTSWTEYFPNWPCEVKTVSEGEKIAGRQARTNTVKVLLGEYLSVENVTTEMQCVLDGHIYNVNAVMDQGGDRHVMRIELKESR